MTTARLNWGILGPGGIATAFVDDLCRTGGQVVAVASRVEDRSAAFAQRFGIPKSYGSYEALVNDPDVDIVYVATPHVFHAEHARLALHGGKHVLVEKPFALNEHQAQSVLSLAQESGLLALEGMWTRCLPHMAHIRFLIDSGALGTVIALNADHSQALSRDPSSRLNDPSLGGGALLDLGIYPVTFAHDLFGPAKSIDAAAVLSPGGIDHVYTAIVRHRDSGISTITGSSIASGNNQATIIGTDGAIHIDPYWYKPTSFRLCDPDGSVREEYGYPVTGHGFHLEAAEFERMVTAGERAGALGSPEAIVGVARTLDEIRRRMGVRYPAEMTSVESAAGV